MRAVLAIILLTLLLAPRTGVQAQLPQTGNGPFYRFIIIVDAGSTMGRRKKATAQTVGELIYSGFEGQIQPGDSFGIWTFQDKVDAFSYPAQVWSPNNRQILAGNAIKLITGLKHRKRSDFDAAVAEMVRATKVSKEVTMFLISDGREVIYGTPYDLDISTTYVLHRQELRLAKQPFVTSIAAKDGRMQAWAVDAGDGKVTVPTIPVKDPPKALAADSPPSPSKPKTPAPPEKADPSPKPADIAARKPLPPPIADRPRTQTETLPTPKKKSPPTPRPVAAVVKSSPPPAKIDAPDPVPTLDRTTPPQKPVEITQPRANNNTSRANPRSAKLTGPPGPSRQAPDTAPIISKSAKPAPSNTQSATAPPKETSGPPSPTANTNSAGATTANNTPPKPTIDIPAAAANASGSAPPPTPASPAQTGMILPPDEPASPARYLFLGLALLAVAGIMVFVALRRGRSQSGASLISQSLDREQN